MFTLEFYTLPNEIFLDIPSYEGLYKVSNYGRIWSIRTQKILALTKKKKSGYMQVSLFKNSKTKSCLVHNLVLLAFIGVCPDGQESRHFPDRDKTNNKLSNLSYATHFDNMGDRLIHETLPIGDKNGKCKMTNKRKEGLLFLHKTGKFTQEELASFFNVDIQTINVILNNRKRKKR